MPNWCRTRISFRNTAEKLKALDVAFREATKPSPENVKVGHTSLAELLIYMGLSLDDTKHQGRISYYWADNKEIYIETVTAWAPMLAVFRLFADKYAPGTNIVYTAEEPGCGLYWTNDPEIRNLYYADGHIEGELSDLCDLVNQSPETVARTLEDELGLPLTEDSSDEHIQELCRKANERIRKENLEFYLILKPYEFVELTEVA